jgi:hypothetical protein
MALTTTVTAEDVATRAALRGDDATEKAEKALALALELLEQALADAYRQPGPEDVDEMVLRVAQDACTTRRTGGTGGQTTRVEDGQQVRVSRDPLASARDMLGRYVIGLA